MIKIHKDMTITEVMDIDASLVDVLNSYNLNCQNCPGSQNGTIEEAALGHDIKLDELLEALNGELKKHV